MQLPFLIVQAGLLLKKNITGVVGLILTKSGYFLLPEALACPSADINDPFVGSAPFVGKFYPYQPEKTTSALLCAPFFTEPHLPPCPTNVTRHPFDCGCLPAVSMVLF